LLEIKSELCDEKILDKDKDFEYCHHWFTRPHTHTHTSRALHSRCSIYLTLDYIIASFCVGRPLICAHRTHLSTGPQSDTHTHTISFTHSCG